MKRYPLLLRLFDALFLLLLALYIVGGMALVPFHGDEATQIYMSHDYAYQFIQRDLSLVTYHEPPISAQEQELRLLNGTINKYLIGLAWHLGGFSAVDLNEQWDWGGDWNYNQTTGHAPSEALLMVSRIPSTLLLVVGMVAMFALGGQVGGRPVAYLAALFYALHPALLLNGRRAMMEGSFIAFSLLTVLAAVWWLKGSTPHPGSTSLSVPSPTQARRGGVLIPRVPWLAAAALGICAGLALASKHTALFTVVAVFGGCLLWIVVEPQRRKEREGTRGKPGLHDVVSEKQLFVMRLLQLLLAGVVALVVFYVLNPAWWGDPVTRAGQVLERRQELLTEQTTFFGGYTGVGDALTGFIRQALVAQPQYYEAPGWDVYLSDQIARYEASPWAGVAMGGSVIGAVILGIFVLLGLWSLLRDRALAAGIRWLVGVWALAMIVTTALLTPVEWQRYYLPVYPAIGLLAALGLWGLARNLLRRRATR